MTSFELQVKKYRLLKEMTQDELANVVCIRRETIGRLEQAKYDSFFRTCSKNFKSTRSIERIFISI